MGLALWPTCTCSPGWARCKHHGCAWLGWPVGGCGGTCELQDPRKVFTHGVRRARDLSWCDGPMAPSNLPWCVGLTG